MPIETQCLSSRNALARAVHTRVSINLQAFLLALCLLPGTLLFAADGTFTPREPRYRVHPGDVIGVTYRYSPEYNATVNIQPDGFVTLPLLGDINLSGLTVDQIREKILAKANERLNAPEIVVDLKGFEQPYYIVGGEVGTPGKYEVHGPTTALRAVQMAGGFKTSSKTNQVLLIRPINDVDAETKLIDLKRVMNKGQVREDIQLRAGDMLIVPKNRIAKIEPIIRLANPGAYGLYLNPTNF